MDGLEEKRRTNTFYLLRSPHLFLFLTPPPLPSISHTLSPSLSSIDAQPHYILQEIIAFVWKECREEGKGARLAPFVKRRGSLKDNLSILPYLLSPHLLSTPPLSLLLLTAFSPFFSKKMFPSFLSCSSLFLPSSLLDLRMSSVMCEAEGEGQ